MRMACPPGSVMAVIELSRPRRDTVLYALLAVQLTGIVCFAAVYDSLDFGVYMWGGRAVASDARLYLEQALEHWFTYTPFAAVVFAPIAVLPETAARVLWDLASVVALAAACAVVLKLAGVRPSRRAVAATLAGTLPLAPVYHTLFQGQINLILLAMVFTDIWRVSRGRPAGIGIGVAAAIKLTPAIFIVLLLVGRRRRDAVTAVLAFLGCGLVGYVVAPEASRLYWLELFHDTTRVGAPYISNQSPYAAAIRILGGVEHLGGWYTLVPLLFGTLGLSVAAVLARRGDWLGAVATTGVTSLLVSPISWSHHWVWALPALAVLVRAGGRARACAVGAYVLFALAPQWWTPHDGGPGEYGWHGWVTAVANCYLIAGVAFLAYMVWVAFVRRPEPGADGPRDRGLAGVGNSMVGVGPSAAREDHRDRVSDEKGEERRAWSERWI